MQINLPKLQKRTMPGVGIEPTTLESSVYMLNMIHGTESDSDNGSGWSNRRNSSDSAEHTVES